MKRTQGFTLIELLLVMIIIAILAALISGNFLNSLQKGRDARRKNDLTQIQRALEMLYEDAKSYPSGALPFGAKLCNGTCNSGSKAYMVTVPVDPNSTFSYQYIVDSTDHQYYYLLSCIENYHNDKGAGVSENGYCDASGNCGSPPQCGACGNCKFYVSSPNAPPLITPVP